MTLQQAFLNVSAMIPVEDYTVKTRLDRGYGVVISKGYTITKSLRGSEYIYHVHRASTSLLEDSSALYTVDRQGCSCPDAVTARAGLCKHKIAVMLQQEMEKD